MFSRGQYVPFVFPIVLLLVIPLIVGIVGSIMDKPSLIKPAVFTHFLLGMVMINLADINVYFLLVGVIVILFMIPIAHVHEQLENDLVTDKLETVTLVPAPKGPTDGYIL